MNVQKRCRQGQLEGICRCSGLDILRTMTQLALGFRIITASCMQHAFILTSFVHELQKLPRYHTTPYAELDSW